MGSIEWWRGTATHMWRTYFSLERDGFNWDKLSEPERKIYAICNHIYLKQFVKTDQDILKNYFTSRWGDDLYAVDEYSEKHKIPKSVIWMVIRRANRTVMEECGFLDRKEDENE